MRDESDETDVIHYLHYLQPFSLFFYRRYDSRAGRARRGVWI